MFCSNCGQEILDPNQKFCHTCGNEIQTPPKTSILSPTPTHTEFVATPQMSFQEGRPGPHSKRCLAFSIVSIGMAVAMVIYGGFLRLFYALGMPFSFFVVGMIIALIFHTVGLIFGIISRKNGNEAIKSEPKNAIEIVGSIFAIFGIIGNTVLIIVALIILAIAFV